MSIQQQKQQQQHKFHPCSHSTGNSLCRHKNGITFSYLPFYSFSVSLFVIMEPVDEEIAVMIWFWPRSSEWFESQATVILKLKINCSILLIGYKEIGFKCTNHLIRTLSHSKVINFVPNEKSTIRNEKSDIYFKHNSPKFQRKQKLGIRICFVID